ncbi:nas-33 [Pristionchus pacificus]|nr:nas-33 [Pristionchus pacificus]
MMITTLVLLSLAACTAQPQPDYDMSGERGPPMGPRGFGPRGFGPRGFGPGPGGFGPRGGFDGPPPPWARRHHHHRPPWARGPPPPWRRPPPFDEPRGIPPPDYDNQQEEQPQPPAESPPPPQPAPNPLANVLSTVNQIINPGRGNNALDNVMQTVNQVVNQVTSLITAPHLKKMVTSIEKWTSAYQRPGQSYSNVLNILDKFYKNQGGQNFDMNTVELVEGPAGTELGPNKRVAGALFEIDMILTVAQASRIASGRRRRMLVARAAQRWPTTINYKFAETDAEWRARISQTLRAFENNTCLRFREQSNPVGDYMLFARGDGCMSSLGRLGGAQLVSIGYGCEQMGIIAHEVSHALGFWHEHSRPDRDQFIKVNPGNMQQGTQGQFVKRSIQDADTQGLPFDYASVMHYAANSYARTSLLFTLEPRDVLYRSTIGSRSEPSFLDYKHINKLYCSRTCTPLACQNGGYVDPNNCGVCKCPIGLGGRRCERVQESVCGMELTASPNWRNISYSGSSRCYWRVKAPSPTQHVEFELTHVWFTCAPSCNEYVELKWHDDLSLAGGRLCCRPEGGVRVTETDTLVVIAKAQRSSQFTLRYRVKGGAKIAREVEWSTVPPPENIIAATSDDAAWSGWSEWGGCSEACGACGRQTRTRTCYGREQSVGGDCPGPSEEREVCNRNACRPGETLSKRSAEGSHIRRKRSWCCEGSTLSNYDTCERI